MSMKQKGVRDLEAVRSRAFRLLSMNRISMKDADYIAIECENLARYIMEMEESDGKAKATRDQVAG